MLLNVITSQYQILNSIQHVVIYTWVWQVVWYLCKHASTQCNAMRTIKVYTETYIHTFCTCNYCTLPTLHNKRQQAPVFFLQNATSKKAGVAKPFVVASNTFPVFLPPPAPAYSSSPPPCPISRERGRRRSLAETSNQPTVTAE